jgi:hypothetical protein
MMVKPCDIVSYKLSDWDMSAANRKGQHQNSKGDIVPLIVVRVWNNEYGDKPGVNGQAILDGDITIWVTSVREYEGGYWGNSSLEYNDHETPIK